VSVTRPSLARRAFLPSAIEEPPGPNRVDSFARLRAIFAVLAINLDVFIYFSFRTSPRFDAHALRWFFFLNVPLLAVSGLTSWFLLRVRRRFYDAISTVCVVIEMFTAVVWIQLTGTVSSYFLFAIPILVLIYRFFAGYRLGLIALLAGMGFHLGALVLEALGVLRHSSLFVDDPGAIYTAPMFRISAMVSIQFMYFATFILANVISVALREKEEALDVAQRNLERVAAEVQPGRLSGRSLDGKWTLGELLGRGGMGEVYQAQPKAGGAPVAIKILYAHLSEPDELARFRREAQVAGKLSSGRVPQVLDFGRSDDGQHFLVMELLHGEDFGTLLRRRTLIGPDELLPIVDQLAEALEDAHAAGIVHRDLKPQNVFLVSAQNGVQVKLLDFGVARLLVGATQSLTQTAMVLGSPGYLSPEQAVAHFGEVGPRSDVFALGAIIYRALTGHNAFPSRHPAAAIYEAVHVEPVPATQVRPDLPADLDAVLALAMAKHPEDRYGTPSELVRDLRAAFAGALPDTVRVRASRVARAQVPKGSPALEPTLADSRTPSRK